MTKLNLESKHTRADAERGKKEYAFIDMIQIEELHEFTIDILNEFGNEELLEESNKIADILLSLLKKKKLITNGSHQSFVDILLVSTLAHNLFYDKEDWTTLFQARKILEPIAKEKGVVKQFTDAIFQTVESQLGEDSPVPSTKPPVNSPTELFAYCVWFAKEYTPQV